MRPYILETCVDSVESAQAAQRGGATRLELCANLPIGGTTPSPFLFEAVKACCTIPVRVLIRPRFGDFCYTQPELAIMRREIENFCAPGADGVVIGVLAPDGTLCTEQMKPLIDAAKGCGVTLHRAIDMCRDQFAALEQAAILGVDTILTSGGQSDCLAGADALQELHRRAAGRLHILAGGGVTSAVVQTLLEQTDLRCFHMSAKQVLESPMRYRTDRVHMGLPGLGEYKLWRTCEQTVRQAAQKLEKCLGGSKCPL